MLIYARHNIGNIRFHGKISGDISGVREPFCGEMNPDIIIKTLAKVKGIQYEAPGYPPETIV
jgi:hypothetical protein